MTRRAAILALVCAPVILLAQVSSSDFARGAGIRAEDGGSVFRLLLPDDVYETVTRPDLGDIRVLNAAGDAVPHTLRQAPRPADPQAEWRSVPSFPMSEAPAGTAAKTHVRIGAGGAVLEVTNDASVGKAITGYLVDTSALNEPITSMSLSWQAPQDETFLARVAVQSSDDLDRWQTVVPSAALAQLRRDAYTLMQSEIELLARGERAKYFRLTWPKELAAVTLTSVRVRLRTAAAQRETRWKALTAERVEAPGAARYDTRAVLPIEYLDIEFLDPIDAASVTLRSRATPSSQWVMRHTGVFYALKESDTTIRSSPAHVARTTDRYWTIETTREGGWKRERAPRLTVGWHPHELLFLAQGAPPYTLVYGSARIGPTDAPVDVLLATLSDADRAERVRLATLGEARSLGGEAALTPPTPVRRTVLWAVLVAAVAALAFVAIRLFRDTARAG
ncbi:MAG: DUF3999 domain-containing protein [Vicinamibacterales bacterium]